VGRQISDVGDEGISDYRRERQEFFRQRGMDMVWIWKIFGSVISVGSRITVIDTLTLIKAGASPPIN
jgi:hypothetical protein